MKTKLKEPAFLAQLRETAYKMRLEEDLAQLSLIQGEQQNFFIDLEYPFADGKPGPVLVVGLTTAWKDFVRNEVKVKKNPNFVMGECSLNGTTLNLNLQKGRAKPKAIEKELKKHSVLKKYTLEFVLDENIEEELGEGAEALAAVSSQTGVLSKDKIYDKIKEKVEKYKGFNPDDKEGRKNAINALLGLISDWHKAHPKPKAKEQQIAQALTTLHGSLVQQFKIMDKGQNNDLYYDIVEEFNEVRNLDLAGATKRILEDAIKECQDVLGLISQWEKNYPAQPSPNQQQQNGRVAQIKQFVEDFFEDVQERLDQKDYLSEVKLLSPAHFISLADIALKGDSKFTDLVKALEQIQEATDDKGLTLDARIAQASKAVKDAETGKALEDLVEGKMAQLRRLQQQAQAWVKTIGEKAKIGASKQARNEEKKNAIEQLSESIEGEIERCYHQITQVKEILAMERTRKNLRDKTKENIVKELKDGQEKIKAAKVKLGDQATEKEILKEAFGLGEADTNYNMELFIAFKKMAGDGQVDQQEKEQVTKKLLDTYLDEQLATNQAAQQNILFAFRGNTPLTNLLADVTTNKAEGFSKYVMNSLEDLSNTRKGLDFKKLDLTEEQRAELAEDFKRMYEKFLKSFVGSKALAQVPQGLKDFAKEMYAEILSKGRSVAEAEDFVKGMIFLRYINPLLINLGVEFSGKENQAIFTLFSKILQNQANKTVPHEPEFDLVKPYIKSGEEILDTFTRMILEKIEAPTPEEEELAGFAAAGFQEAINEYCSTLTFDKIIQNGRHLAHFRAYAQVATITDGLEFLLDYRLGALLQNPKHTYLTYFAKNAVNEINMERQLVEIRQQVALVNNDPEQISAQQWATLAQQWPLKDMYYDVSTTITDQIFVYRGKLQADSAFREGFF